MMNKKLMIAICSLLFVATACQTSPRSEKPPYYGAFFLNSGDYLEIPATGVIGLPRLGQIDDNIPRAPDAQPAVILWQENTVPEYLQLFLIDTKKEISFTTSPKEDGIYELRPREALKNGTYCYIQGNPAASELNAWCFQVGQDTADPGGSEPEPIQSDSDNPSSPDSAVCSPELIKRIENGDTSMLVPGVQLEECDFDYSGKLNLSNLDLSGANFRNSDFSRADLTNTNLSNAILENARFDKTIITGANLTNANLTGAYFNEVEVDESTLMAGANLALATFDLANLSSFSQGDTSNAIIFFNGRAYWSQDNQNLYFLGSKNYWTVDWPTGQNSEKIDYADFGLGGGRLYVDIRPDVGRLIHDFREVVSIYDFPSLELITSIEGSGFYYFFNAGNPNQMGYIDYQEIGVLRVRNLLDSSETKHPLPPGNIKGMGFSPDGTLVAAAVENDIFVLNIETEEAIFQESFGIPAENIKWNPVRNFLAAANSQQVRVWNMDSGEEVYAIEGELPNSNALEWSPNGQFLAFGGGENGTTIMIVDMETKEIVARLNYEEFRLPQRTIQTNSGIFFLDWSPDSKHLIAQYWDSWASIIWPEALLFPK